MKTSKTGRTITSKTKAWFTSDYCGPEDLNRPPEEAINGLGFSSHDMQRHGWVYVGQAEITVHVESEDKLAENKVESLRAELQNVRAEAQVKANAIEGKIQKLLAISFEPRAPQ